MSRRPRPSLLAVAVLVTLAATLSAAAQNACCLPDSSCADVADEAACNALGGVMLPGGSCAMGACNLGACCDGLNCLQAEPYPCITGGRTFAGAGVSCLEDPCDAGVGACCYGDGTCDFIGPDPCAASGGTWLGAGTNCDNGGDCVFGACCVPGDCFASAGYECDAAGGAFVEGGDCALDACDVDLACPLDAFLGFEPDGPGFFTAYTSESAAGFQRYERFDVVPGVVDGVRFWGLQGDNSSGDFVPCTDPSADFSISFHALGGVGPGPQICSYSITATVTPAGVSYQGFPLYEFEAALPSPCIPVEGWISIVGHGDPDCWFLWMSGLGGDQYSWCDGCQSTEQGDDLAYCLLGTAGGVFGACCDQSSGVCIESVEITDCVGVGLRFEPDVACNDLDPACTAVTAACCRDGGVCSLELPDACAALGGTWLGAGTTCDDCPDFGACCFGFESCDLTTEDECATTSGTWLGPDTTCGECPVQPECPPESLFSQAPEGPDGFEAGTSEQSAGFLRYEDFAGLQGAIEEIVFWGFDLEYLGGSSFTECVEPDPTFIVALHEDAGGAPGAAVCSYELLATRTPTNIFYQGAELNEYRVVLPAPCALVNGWVSIVGLGDPDCWFLWNSSAIGDSWCDGCSVSPQDLDLAVCLIGPVGGVFGACCNEATGQCANNVEIDNCTAPGLRFEPGLTCAELDPPCGVILGACCFGDGTCALLEQADCADAAGDWLGANTLCDQCRCVVPCPDGAADEGEVACSDDYIDVTNGGCDSDPPVYGTAVLGQTICGTGGVYLSGGDAVPDTDWYELVLPAEIDLVWTVQAEFPFLAGVADGETGCPPVVLGVSQGDTCEEAAVAVTAGPGRVWLVVQAAAFADDAACPSAYTARVDVDVSCPGDINGDGTTDVADLVQLILAWGTADPAADIDGSGLVDVADLVIVILEWGPCGT